tara:strand:+ start:235 stop:1362 length:1128 start_codon:yes stop_codon:yes gene_type:complete
MKIGIVCFPTYGGSGVIATELGKSLANKGHEVHFFSYDYPFRLNVVSENIFFHELNTVDYPLFMGKPYDLALTSKIIDVARHEKIDLLHVHYAIPHSVSAFLAKQILRNENYHLPVITTLHGTDINLVGKDPSIHPVVEFVLNQSDALTSVSKSLMHNTFNHFNVQKEINVIPNFIDMELFCFSDKEVNKYRSRFASVDESIVIHVSNFRKVKRVEDTIKVFSKISKSVNSVMLMVGDGPERQRVEDLSRSMNLSNVIFLGKARSVELLLSISDLFLLTSESESFGLSALEAMAAKTPVISSNIGGLPEINIHNKTGFLCDVGDVEGMSHQALSILKNKSILNQFKLNAFNHAKKFSIKNIYPIYEKLYFDLIKV